MNSLLTLAAYNTAAALVLAVCVFAVTRVWRNPPVAHVLWLLVLVKLVIPPIVRVDGPSLWPQQMDISSTAAVNGSRSDVRRVESASDAIDRPPTKSAATDGRYRFTAELQAFWDHPRPLVFGIWLGGIAMCAAVAARRIVRFERLLRDTLPASGRLQRLASNIAGRLGVRRVPDVRLAECVEIPLVWWAGRRATIVLPLRPSSPLDEVRVALILAHELAHLRRRDHWVRAIELVVSIVYWWNPLVWLIRREIHRAEDACCDAWVRVAFPDRRKQYAELVLQVAQSLGNSPRRGQLLAASPFLRSLSTKARIEMILESRFTPSLSGRCACAIALVALLVLPLFVQGAANEARAGSANEPTASGEKLGIRTTSEFPYAVRVEQGVTRFEKGDNITIEEVRGTAETFTPGNIYWIKGTYKLASRDRATVAAYTTAMDAAKGRSASLKVQSTIVDQGAGTFTLFLPMTYRGFPHVSFYPADGGEGFGGNYFGTGESLLKRWWDERQAD